MVIQCPECQSRFKMADEKARNGVKVRCSRCQHVFPVQVPAAAAAPPQQEMPAAVGNSDNTLVATPPAPAIAGAAPATAEAADDFAFGAASEPAAETADETGLDGFDFADFSVDVAADPAAATVASGADELDLGSFDIGAAAPFAPEAGGDDFHLDAENPSTEFSFDAGQDKAALDYASEAATSDFAFDSTAGDDDFAFDEEPDFGSELPAAGDGEGAYAAASDDAFSFGDISPDDAFAIDPPPPAAETPAAPWMAGDGPNDEFEFSAPAAASTAEEFDFSNLSFGDDTPAAPAAPPLSPAVSDVLPPLAATPAPLPVQERPVPPAAPSAEDDDILFVPPPQPKKRGLSGTLGVLVLLLLLLGGAAGYFFWQGGMSGISSLLAGVAGETPAPAAAGQIRLADLNGVFVDNNEAGQLFVIHGRVINEYPEARSAIAVKGVLFNQAGQALMQQTVFSGNSLDENALRTLPFAKIEERMNNQFGDSLSNLNVGPGKSLPFTIVFRNLPTGLAEFTTEVTDSKPGSS